MIATIELSKNLENTLARISKKLHKEENDVIKEAIVFYANSIESPKKNKLKQAIEKTKDIDKKEFYDFVGTQNDGL